MKKVTVTAYPFATQYGRIEVPDNLEGEELREFLRDNWDNIAFAKVNLDYAGCEFEVE